MQAVYGKEACKKNNVLCQSEVADKPHYLMPSQQGVNECGIYCLKFACTYDGDRCVEHIKNYDVCPCRLPSFCFMKRKIFSSYLFFFAADCADIFIFCRRTVLRTGRLSTCSEFFSMRITRCLLRTFRRKSSASPLLLRCQHRVKNCC